MCVCVGELANTLKVSVTNKSPSTYLATELAKLVAVIYRQRTTHIIIRNVCNTRLED